MNKVFLAGNLTRDPEYNNANGTSILKFGLAVNDRVRNKQTQEWEDRPNFFDCVIFAKRADALSAILAKGMKVAIEGHLRWHSWEDQDSGNKRSKVDVICDDVVLMQRREGDAAARPAAQPAAPAAVEAFVRAPVYDDDLPF